MQLRESKAWTQAEVGFLNSPVIAPQMRCASSSELTEIQGRVDSPLHSCSCKAYCKGFCFAGGLSIVRMSRESRGSALKA